MLGYYFVRGHYLFREANSFPRAQLEENSELQGTDNAQGQISEHIFAPMGAFFATCKALKSGEYLTIQYSPKSRWLAVDIYRAKNRRVQYPPLPTDTEVNSCFSIYVWIYENGVKELHSTHPYFTFISLNL